jgi:hypothetical protein
MIMPSSEKTVSSVCDRNGSSEGRLAGLGRCRRWRLRPRGALAGAGVHPVEIRRTKMLPYQKRIVRSLFSPPERSSFKPTPPWAPSNPLRWSDSDIRTKMAVVRLHQRRCAGREGKRPKGGLLAGPGGSDNWAGMAAFCGVPAADQERKKNVSSEETGGGRGARPETFSNFEHTRVGDVARVEV